MSDIFTKAKRSEVMSRIRSRGNKDTEGAMVLLLRAAGIKGWRKHLEVRIRKEKGRKRGGKGRTSNRLHRRPIKRPTSNIERRTKRGSEPVSRRGRIGRAESSNIERKQREVEVSRASLVNVRPFRVRPDFVFPKEKVAVFVDGCFWHGCPWHGTKPASNKSFWQQKLQRNRDRDRVVTHTLRKNGWKVVRIWEHSLPRAAKEPKELEKLLAKLLRNIELVAPAGKQGVAAKRRKSRKEG